MIHHPALSMYRSTLVSAYQPAVHMHLNSISSLNGMRRRRGHTLKKSRNMYRVLEKLGEEIDEQ